MIGFRATVESRIENVKRSAEYASYRNLRHAAFSISKNAKASIIKTPFPSDPGEPPTTRGKGRKNLRGAIFTDATKESAVIGPRESWVGDVGEAHEFGEKREGDDFPERSFMEPALLEAVPRFATDWRGTIGE